MLLEALQLGVGAGGTIRQKVYADPLGLRIWERTDYAEVTVRIVNSLQWRALTGEDPPPSPVSAHDYSDWGLPWFDLYDADTSALYGTSAFKALPALTIDDASVKPRSVKRIHRTPSGRRRRT
jgi:hypothetical protein